MQLSYVVPVTDDSNLLAVFGLIVQLQDEIKTGQIPPFNYVFVKVFKRS